MPIFEIRRYEQILPQMLASVATRAGMIDVSDKSLDKHVLAAAARQDSEQWYQLYLLLQLFSIDSAQKADLDARAREIQPGTMVRDPARKAVVSLVFTRPGTTGTTTIAAGTQAKTPSGQVFMTLAAGEITSTSIERVTGHGVGKDSGLVAAEALVAGEAGNVAPGTIIRFVAKPTGIDAVTNLTAALGGAEQESDDSFRRRLKAFVSSLARCHPTAIEQAVIGKRDPVTGKTILYAKLQEDVVNRGYSVLYVDDGTGSAESVEDYATPIVATFTWNGTTTVTATSTAEVVSGEWVRLDADGQWFEVNVVSVGSFTILNPGADTIPTGATASSKCLDILTEGLSPTDEAVGGETRLTLDNIAIKDSLPIHLTSDVNGNLVEGVDYTLDPTSGQVVFTAALVAGEQVVAGYVRYTGVIEYAQRIVDGVRSDRVNYPGYRAGGVMVQVQTPQVLIQTIQGTITVAEGYDHATVSAAVIAAAKAYVNTLQVSGDLIRVKLASTMSAVPGVSNLILTLPANDVIMLDDQIARTTDANVTIL
jgi:uncharacterized phage protein gp47/JayE